MTLVPNSHGIMTQVYGLFDDSSITKLRSTCTIFLGKVNDAFRVVVAPDKKVTPRENCIQISRFPWHYFFKIIEHFGYLKPNVSKTS